MTEVIDFKNGIDEKKLKFLGKEIKKGKCVIFPTETVYGIGANALDAPAVDKIYDFKCRYHDNPLIVHVSDFDMLDSIVLPYSDLEKKLMHAFMPGPFTLILKKKEVISRFVTCGLDTVGIRMPSNEIAHKLIKFSNTPIAAPSANLSGKPSGTNINDIFSEFDGKVDYIIDGGVCEIGIESTVVKVIDDVPVILRPGKVTLEDIVSVAGIAKVHNTVVKPVDLNEKVESPGVKYKHYAPNAKTILLYSHYEDVLINEIYNYIVPNTCIIGPEEWKEKYDCTYIPYGKFNNFQEISKNLYKCLREADTYNPDLIILVGVEEVREGLAIMNRMLRASSYNFYKF